MATLRMSPEEFNKELEKSVWLADGQTFPQKLSECYDQATGRLSLDEIDGFEFHVIEDYPCYCCISYTVNSDLVITEVEFDEEDERAEFLENEADDYADPESEADDYIARVWEHVGDCKDSTQEALNRIKKEWGVR